jgi:hypothetical protein
VGIHRNLQQNFNGTGIIGFLRHEELRKATEIAESASDRCHHPAAMAESVLSHRSFLL